MRRRKRKLARTYRAIGLCRAGGCGTGRIVARALDAGMLAGGGDCFSLLFLLIFNLKPAARP